MNVSFIRCFVEKRLRGKFCSMHGNQYILFSACILIRCDFVILRPCCSYALVLSTTLVHELYFSIATLNGTCLSTVSDFAAVECHWTKHYNNNINNNNNDNMSISIFFWCKLFWHSYFLPTFHFKNKIQQFQCNSECCFKYKPMKFIEFSHFQAEVFTIKNAVHLKHKKITRAQCHHCATLYTTLRWHYSKPCYCITLLMVQYICYRTSHLWPIITGLIHHIMLTLSVVVVTDIRLYLPIKYVPISRDSSCV